MLVVDYGADGQAYPDHEGEGAVTRAYAIAENTCGDYVWPVSTFYTYQMALTLLLEGRIACGSIAFRWHGRPANVTRQGQLRVEGGMEPNVPLDLNLRAMHAHIHYAAGSARH